MLNFVRNLYFTISASSRRAPFPFRISFRALFLDFTIFAISQKGLSPLLIPLGMFFVLYHFRYLPEGAFPYVNTFSASFALYHISYLPKGTSTFINAFSAVFIFLYFTIFAITEYPNRGGN